jgi:hypothetical protein
MPQLYVIPVESVTGFGCHHLAYILKSAGLPNTMKIISAAMPQTFFHFLLLTSQASKSSPTTQLNGERGTDNIEEAICRI